MSPERASVSRLGGPDAAWSVRELQLGWTPRLGSRNRTERGVSPRASLSEQLGGPDAARSVRELQLAAGDTSRHSGRQPWELPRCAQGWACQIAGERNPCADARCVLDALFRQCLKDPGMSQYPPPMSQYGPCGPTCSTDT